MASLDVSTPKRSGRSPGRKGKPKDYTSEGVEDNDIAKLPVEDWYIIGGLTLVGTVVRLFRIYQPSSVVFDEVQ